MSAIQDQTRNQVLLGLLPADLILLGEMVAVELTLGQHLEAADTPVATVYFPETAMISVVAQTPGHKDVEVGLIGWEGMTGLSVVQGDSEAVFETYVQAAGRAHSITTAGLLAAVSLSPTLRDTLLLHGRSFGLQVASTAIANTFSLEERLARWLLMVGDRLGDQFDITHEFLGIMLCSRRAGVTVGLSALEARGLITTSRGTIELVDRAGLVAASQGSYGLAELQSERLLLAQPA